MEQDHLSEIYLKYHKEIYLYLFSLSKNKETAEDLLQDTFVKAMMSLSDKHENVRAWLYLVARNLFLNQTKKMSRETALEEEQEISVPDTMPDNLIEGENKKMLYAAMQKLSQQKREILTLQYWGNFSQKEISAMLKITPENVRVLGYRAKKDLKKYLEGMGYEV